MSDGRTTKEDGARSRKPAASPPPPDAMAESPLSEPYLQEREERERILKERIDRLIERKRREQDY